MNYDSWKTTEPQTGVAFVCDGCELLIDERDVEWIDGGCWCAKCGERLPQEPD